MAHIRVASVVGNTRRDSYSPLVTWAANYATKRRRLNLKLASFTPTALILQHQEHQAVARDKAFDQSFQFSFLRFITGLVSLLLVFSDIFRGGLGVSTLGRYYPPLQPDEVLGFGTSWNYSVFEATKEESLDEISMAKVWSYKYDSTSIVWRAFARHFKLAEYPQCLLYESQCPNETFPGSVAFNMIDSMINAISAGKTRGNAVALTLRSENEYIDRLHQFILPNWLTNYNWRTNQALYYSPDILDKTNARTVCFPGNGDRRRTPHFCQELWTNLERSCAPGDTARAAGLLYVHTMERLRNLQTRFPNLTTDLTFLESQEDLQVCQGGISTTGFRRTDVSTIFRARNCTFNVCETVFMQDYRYETGLLTSDIIQWYRLVAALRSIGQVYFWLRGIGLMLSCFFVYGSAKTDNKMLQFHKACRLFMKVPTQCVVYGSSFPIICYVLAHILDSPFTYNVLESHFFSQGGSLYIEPRAFIAYAVVQMRSVWIYALIWHFIVHLSALRGLIRSNQVHSGIFGVPEFLLSAFASVTLIAQYRSTTFRSSKIDKIFQLPSNSGRGWVAAKHQYNSSRLGRGRLLLGGVIIDLKFLVLLTFAIAILWITHLLWVKYSSWKHGERRYRHWALFPPTPVPYSAGILWPTVSASVQWSSDYYCIRDERYVRGPLLLKVVKQAQNRVHRPVKFWIFGNADAKVVAANFTVQAKYLTEGERRLRQRFSRRLVNPYRFIQHRLKCLHRRSDTVQANVAFMNVVMMSDPLVFLNLMLGCDQLVFYQSVWRPQQILLLPELVVSSINPYASGLKLLRKVHPSDLTWPELVQCG